MERSEQIHPLFLTFGFLWSRLLTPHVCSVQAPLCPTPYIFQRGKDQGERRGGGDGEIKKRKEPEPRAGDNV